MIVPQPGNPFTQGHSTPPIQDAMITPQGSCQAESPVEGLQDDWRIRLRNLQEWICELLIKNQQLRMALIDTEARALEYDDGQDL